ncbi:mitochondrial phosphate carrier protein [Beauveria brongniartii RCEF 3172]|uniref:Mitochondrial phosphate carrier protein n=1 Tax=Beauveria brongniartii RCEF 3172 TaxID=1081107 RepID=A0A167GEQ9_9HYPO|nr:mitochondrial phosphate carrier protein [Beauveria brongniartii RCEF 3172]
MIITRGVSLTNFLVASTALGFQVFVLYPWHKELDARFEELRKEHLKVLDAVENSISKQQRKTLSDELNDLKSRSATSLNFAATFSPRTGDATRPVLDRLMPIENTSSSMRTATQGIADVSLYARYALAGAFCCAFTHAILTPVDVQIAKLEGPATLLTGLAPTVAGYCLQGAFKFGGYEFFKAHAVDYLGYATAADNRNAVYLTSAAAAEFFGDIALCPFESVRIRLVSHPTYANGLMSALARMGREEGLRGFYSGLSPILLKHFIDKSSLSPAGTTGINLAAGLVAGLAAAVVSQPADTILSKVNKEKGRVGEGNLRRLLRLAVELGPRGAFAGTRARLVMVGCMTAVQFGIYGNIKKLFGATDGVELKSHNTAYHRVDSGGIVSRRD